MKPQILGMIDIPRTVGGIENHCFLFWM